MIVYDHPPRKLVCRPHPPPKQECCIDRIHSLRKPQHGRHFGEAPYDQCRRVKLLSELPPNEQRTWTGTKEVSALTQSTRHKNPEHSTRTRQ